MCTGDEVRWLMSNDLVERIKDVSGVVLLLSSLEGLGDATNKLGSRKAESLVLGGARASTPQSVET